MEFAIESKEPTIRCPLSQLSSMNRRTDVWSVTEWSTKFRRAHGETSKNGLRGPYPQRPSAWGFPLPLYPGKAWVVAAAPQKPGAVKASVGPSDWLTIGPN